MGSMIEIDLRPSVKYGFHCGPRERIELNWIYLHLMNKKQANTLDIEQVRKMLHTYSGSWYNGTDLAYLPYSLYIKVFVYGLEGASI